MLQFPLTWAEDKATVGTDLSADPGAKTEWGGTMPPSAIRDWHQCAKSQARRFRYESPLAAVVLGAFGCHGLVYGFARSRSCHLRLHPYPSLRENVCLTADAPVAVTGHGVFLATIPRQRVVSIRCSPSTFG